MRADFPARGSGIGLGFSRRRREARQHQHRQHLNQGVFHCRFLIHLGRSVRPHSSKFVREASGTKVPTTYIGFFEGVEKVDYFVSSCRKSRRIIFGMDWLNYHHLYYFWNVAKEGTVSAAAEKLHLARTTLTSQIRELEKATGSKLFKKTGRYLELTEFGQHVLGYADEIFAIGRELTDFIKAGQPGSLKKFVVGMPDVVPKLVVFELLKPAIRHADRLHIVCHEGKLIDLLAELALHRLDLIISDAPAPPHVDVRAYSHRLGECGLSFLAVPKLARQLRSGFPNSLHGAPVCLPTEHTAVRRALNRWLEDHDIRPHIVAEFEDSALLKVFGQSGLGVVPIPTAIENEVKKQYRMQLVGRLDEVVDEFYAISVEKRVHHPAVLAIVKQARSKIFDY